MQANLYSALQNTWLQWPDHVALSTADGKLTYRQLGVEIATLCHEYDRLGVKPGDRILCALSNRLEFFVALGAAWACGAVHVGVDHQFTATELASVIDLVQPSVLLFEPAERADQAQDTLGFVSKQHPQLETILVGKNLVDSYQQLHLPSCAAPEAPGYDDMSARILPDEPAIMFLSSGTTGQPKASLGFHGNLCQRWQRLAKWLEFNPDDCHLAHLPLSHGFGLMMAVAALLSGGRLVLLREFSAGAALEAISREGITVFNGAPAHFKLVMARRVPENHSLASLRLSVGTAATFPPGLIQTIWNTLGVRFMYMYGSSEGVGVATTDRDDMLLGSVGKPTPGSVMIVGPDRRALPCGETGEIAFSRSVYPVQYWRSDAAPIQKEPEAVSEAWYYSGDLGRLDEAGRLFVFGRIKHQIDRGGLKVDPVEVERALLDCSGVTDAAVIGRANPILGESVAACIVPAQSAPSLAMLRQELSRVLAPYKLPEALFLLEHIPRTSLGKVDLGQLRQMVDVAPSTVLQGR